MTVAGTFAAFAAGLANHPPPETARHGVALAPDAEAEAAFPALRGAEVRVTTRDGGVHRQRQPTRRGDPDFPLNDGDIGEKFHMLAVPEPGAGPVRTLAAALWRAEALPTVAAIPMPPPRAQG
ncbi:MAG TPA: hypothetical protein VMM59_04285 [Thermohalobaculum sp.]|nr:hypothetical protein [Thermohalobaculum sp.]